MKTRLIALVSVAASCLLLGGCGTSAWQTGLSSGPETAAPNAAEAEVRFREVPWERIDATLSELRADVAADAVHPSEWPEDRKLAHKARLLQGLQISEAATTVRVLGKSQFSTTDKLNVPSEEMRKLANELGADTVVWSSKYVGKADRVVQEPVTLFSDGTYWSRGADGLRSRSVSETQTGWVPVRVQVDETAYIGFFLRCR